jgi:hypothetical protein
VKFGRKAYSYMQEESGKNYSYLITYLKTMNQKVLLEYLLWAHHSFDNWGYKIE